MIMNERKLRTSDHYTYRLSWSDEDQEYVATCVEFPSLSHLAADPVQALQGIRELVQDVVTEMRANSEVAPTPFADEHYSGNFQVRVPPELHRRLVIEAAEAHVSLNRLASFRLAVPTAAPTAAIATPRRTPAKRQHVAV
jgi:predicted HicB family RNase H-like nuclease